MKVAEYKKSISGKRISVVGIGVSNIPLIKFLSDSGAKIVAHDKRTAEQLGEAYNDLKALGVEFVLGEEYLDGIFEDTDIIFKTPGLRPDAPQLVKAAEKGAVITSEMELFLSLSVAEP